MSDVDSLEEELSNNNILAIITELDITCIARTMTLSLLDSAVIRAIEMIMLKNNNI